MASKARAVCHVEKNLKALEQFPRVALNNIRDFQEAFKPVCIILLFLVDRYIEPMYVFKERD